MGKRPNKLNALKNTYIILLILLTQQLTGQIGGRYVYEFLGLPSSSRVSALGGSLISVIDDDVSLALSNPASVSDSMHNSISFSHNFHFAGISNGHLAYGRALPKYGINTHFGMSYISYGDFVLADIYGNNIGTFSGRENAITIGASKKLNEKIVVGANLKGVFGKYESFGSTGIAADLGINYIQTPGKLIFSFVVKNIGTEITTFRDKRHSAPLDIQIGLSNRLKHLPFRFSIIAHQLQQWNIRYDDPSFNQTTDIFNTDISQSPFEKGVDNLFRHLIFSGEFLLGRRENFRLRIGYSHLRRRELSLEDFRSLAGFSLGFGLKVSKFRIDYGVGYHHVAGANNHLTISTNLANFRKKIAE